MPIHPLYPLYRTIYAITNIPRLKFMRRLRGHYYSILMESAGENLQVDFRVRINNPKLVTVGDHCYLGQNAVLYPWNECIVLGNHVLVAAGVRIITRNHAFSDSSIPIAKQGFVDEPVFIEDDV